VSIGSLLPKMLVSSSKDFIRLFNDLVLQGTRLTELYAAYRSGCLGANALDAYFPLFASIIVEKKWDAIEETAVAESFHAKYSFEIPLTFTRQVLGVGMHDGSIIDDKGCYRANLTELKKHIFTNEDFNAQWKSLKEGFIKHCKANGLVVDAAGLDDNIIKFIDTHDLEVMLRQELDDGVTPESFAYAWGTYITELSSKNVPAFEFLANACFSNVLKEAMFYSNNTTASFSDLAIYFDSPIVFALLGMDESPRVDAYQNLLGAFKSSGCTLYLLDHNYEEIKGIIVRSGAWATSNQYDLRRANNVARYFHDNGYDSHTLIEYIDSLESKINELGITVRQTNYDVYENTFQEDEQKLTEMIVDAYRLRDISISEERKQSIHVDVRSIIMTYRIRQGKVSTDLSTAGHLFITCNSAIANVSKLYESNRSINAGHIPACISADFMGAVVWMNNPHNMEEYKKKQLLADCYSFLRPSREMFDRYFRSLEAAKNAGEIDERKFIFLKLHGAVSDALMNVTRGEYARFSDRTPFEVFDEIQANAEGKYQKEAAAHAQTIKDNEEKNKEDQGTITNLTSQVADLERKEEDRVAKKTGQIETTSNHIGFALTLAIYGLPCIVILAVLEIAKGVFSNWYLDGFSWKYLLNGYFIAIVVCLLIDVILTSVLWSKTKSAITQRIEKRWKQKEGIQIAPEENPEIP